MWLFAICFFAYCFTVRFKNKQKQEIKPEVYEKESSMEQKAYEMGFEKGKMAFLIQFKQEIPSVKIEKYTSSKEQMSEHEQKIYEESIFKGYVDGYHKACDSYYPCTRSY